MIKRRRRSAELSIVAGLALFVAAMPSCTSGGSEDQEDDGAGRGGASAGGAVAGTAGAGGRAGAGGAGGAASGGTGGQSNGKGGSSGAGGTAGMGGTSGSGGVPAAGGSSGAGGVAGAGGGAIPDATIIDTHIHFWDTNRTPPAGRDRPVPFPSPGDSIYKPFFPADYRAVGDPLGITGVVLVEASPWLEDNAWMLDLAARDKLVVGVVGNLGEVLGKDGFSAAFEPLRNNPLFRGIRIGGGNVSAAIAGGTTRTQLEQIAAAGLAVDVLGVGASDVANLASKIPALIIVVDHMAGVASRAPTQGWKDGLAAMAKAPKVFLKISGLVEAAGAKPAPSDPAMYRAALDAALAAFGEDRLIYATNWPVSFAYAPLATVHGIVAAWLADKPATVRRKIYWQNARAAYGWVDRR